MEDFKGLESVFVAEAWCNGWQGVDGKEGWQG